MYCAPRGFGMWRDVLIQSWHYLQAYTRLCLDRLTILKEDRHHRRLAPNEIPQYVIDYAPLIHLYSEEQYWPCDISEHLQHTKPYVDYDVLDGEYERWNLTNLDKLNLHRSIYLTSDDNVEENPDWLGNSSNIPLTPPPAKGDSGRRRGGRSDAPAVLIVVEKEHGIVDAFWFFFYSYNLGNTVFNVRFGNHVGDWEHTAMRFVHGMPKEVWLSEHAWGDAYSYNAVEKIGKRPVAYSATGTHAMYSTPGVHQYVLPWGLLHDVTDRGPLWDPTLNSYMYRFHNHSGTVMASQLTPEAPTEWYNFKGRWGDKEYPLSDSRQYTVVGQKHYVSGPRGPYAKNLMRQKICRGGPCDIRHWLPPAGVARFIAEEEIVPDLV